MEIWAENPIQMNYWIPATSLCGTIAAITRLAQPIVRKQLPVRQTVIATLLFCLTMATRTPT
ncbi:hypothetical protein GQ600_10039 [Phytophthora cactorum]|nr:hypothetical protein GQ600_10039 [Phytophthora cactorum]